MALKLCMIGCGGFARLCHGPAQQRYAKHHPDVALAGCCDSDASRAAEYRTRFGYTHDYVQVAEMLAREKPDAVIIAVPPEITAAVAVPVLAQGFPILLEKPPGLTSKELDALMAAAAHGCAPTQVGFNRRYMPVLRKAASIVASEFEPGKISRIDYEMIRFNRWDPDFSTTAVHALDTLLVLAGSPVVVAEVRYQEQHDTQRHAVNVELSAETAAGTRLSLRIQPVAGHNREFVRVHGVGQSLLIAIPASPLTQDEGSVELWSDGKSVMTFSDQGTEMIDRMGIYGELEAFLDGVRRDIPLMPTLSDCGQQVALMEALRTRRATIRFDRD